MTMCHCPVGKITVFFVVIIFIACDSKQPASTNNEITINFTDVTASAGLANFRHVTGAVGDKWFPVSTGSGMGSSIVGFRKPMNM